MGFCALGLEQHRLGLWDLSWDLKKTIFWEMGLGPPFMTLYNSSEMAHALVIFQRVKSS